VKGPATDFGLGSSSAGMPRPSILIVDDDRANRMLLRACLGATSEIYEVSGGAEALELLGRVAIDLVLLDVMMPDLGGLEVCRRIKQSQPDYLPVILLTSFGRQDDRNAGLQAGADDFLTKPFDRHELLLRVRTFVKLRQQDQRIREQLTALNAQEGVVRRQMQALQELDATKDELVALMVHDLRNPLTGITGFIGLVADENPDPGLRSEAEFALQASTRIRDTLDDLLCVRMLETGTLVLRREAVPAPSLVREAIASLRGAALSRRVKISEQIEGDNLWLHADAKLVRRAIENLLSNALKYSPEGASVRAAVRRAGGDVEIEVADRGEGVPESLRHGVFQKFASVEAARGEARRGVGLGLYMVSLVAAAHGGRATVRHRKRGGAAFGLYLPGRSASLEVGA
jgi:two-component system, sensor histidine kinase and response regulator